MGLFTEWREIVIPPHAGARDLIARIEATGMHVEHWAKGLLSSSAIPPRTAPLVRHITRVSNSSLGLTSDTTAISDTYAAGHSQGLSFFSPEDMLALRLSYADQPIEWMRIAMETYVDPDGSCLDLAIVNDGARKDLRTTWAFPQNRYQHMHEWFWILPT